MVMFRHLTLIVMIIIVITNPAGTFVRIVFKVQLKEGLSKLTTESNTNHRWSPGITFPAGIIVI